MNFAFHPDALAELEDATRYYADKQLGLELRFIAAVEACIGKIREHPERFLFLTPDVRRCLVRVFPYAVLYAVEADFILIIAVMHCHRKPGYWRSRIAA